MECSRPPLPMTDTGKRQVYAWSTSYNRPVEVEDRDVDSAEEMARVMANVQADLDFLTSLHIHCFQILAMMVGRVLLKVSLLF